jgi:hypothetical protein
LPSQPFDRLSYLYGQVLTPAQLRRAQDSVYEKFKLHTRCFAGWGVGCGLEVSPVPMPKDPCAPECPPSEPGDPGDPPTPPPQTPGATPGAVEAAKPAVAAAAPTATNAKPEEKKPPPPVFPRDPCNVPKTKVRVNCGFAVDCEGNDLVVRTPLEVDLYSALSAADRHEVEDGQLHTLWLWICFKSYGWEPIRAVMTDGCNVGCDGSHAFEREGFRIRVGLKEPERDDRCETCCDCCGDPCVLLARIEGYRRGVSVGEVDGTVRRPLSRYVPTTVTGVNWFHGSGYLPEEIDELLFTRGMHVHLSREVHADTLIPGVCDVFVYELGSAHRGTVRVLEGHIEKPHHALVDHFVYRLPYRERIDPGDRVVFVFRADHVLDHCCEPVDGNHVGGLVPALPGAVEPCHRRKHVDCRGDPRKRRWTSGNGTPGGTFESWVTAVEEEGGERRIS